MNQHRNGEILVPRKANKRTEAGKARSVSNHTCSDYCIYYEEKWRIVY